MISSSDARFEFWINKVGWMPVFVISTQFCELNPPDVRRVPSTVITHIVKQFQPGAIITISSQTSITARSSTKSTSLTTSTAEMGLCYSRPRRDVYGRRVYSSSYHRPRKVEVVHVHHGGGGYVAPPLVAPITSGYTSGYGTSRISSRRARRYY